MFAPEALLCRAQLESKTFAELFFVFVLKISGPLSDFCLFDRSEAVEEHIDNLDHIDKITERVYRFLLCMFLQLMRLESHFKHKVVHVNYIKEAFRKHPNLKVISLREKAKVACFKPPQVFWLLFIVVVEFHRVDVLAYESQLKAQNTPVSISPLLS